MPKQPKQSNINLGMLDSVVCYQLRRAHTALVQSFAKKERLKGITLGQFGLLVKIKNNAGISQTALAKADGIERSTLGEIIDRFEERELVERRGHVADRRAYALHLTPKGVEVLDEIIPLVTQCNVDMTVNFTEPEREELIRLLKKVAENG